MEYKREKIINYEEYEVDTNGVVYSKQGKPLKYSLNHSGYCMINFMTNGKRKGFAIHTLVAKQFIPNNDIFKTQVNHKDGNKQNNNVENLEWVTCKENVEHSVKVLKNNIGVKNSKSKAINGYDKISGDLKYSFECIADCARALCENTNYRYVQNSIVRVLSGERKSYKGCVWEYLN